MATPGTDVVVCVAERVASICELVSMHGVCRLWRASVVIGFPSWVRMQPAGSSSGWLSHAELLVVRMFLDGALVVVECTRQAHELTERVVLRRHGVMVVCDSRRGQRPWRLWWAGGRLPRTCCSSLECEHSLRVRSGDSGHRGYLILRSGFSDAMRHDSVVAPNVCVAELVERTIDALVETILPWAAEEVGRSAPSSGTVCGFWRMSYRWRRKTYPTLHRRVLGCVRQ